MLASVFLAATAFTLQYEWMLVQRVACGIASAFVFVGGGVLATRLVAVDPGRQGLVLGLYYSGVGWGIVASALIVPLTLGDAIHGWQMPWLAVGGVCAIFSVVVGPTALRLASPLGAGTTPRAQEAPSLWPMAWLLAAYTLYGIGYIGYMTFVIALLKSAGMGWASITAFYVMLGLAVAASGRLWAGVLDRSRGGGAFALLCVLMGGATLLPALSPSPFAAFISGLIFGATFLTVVASTTSFVRHNLPAHQTSAGIAAFTVAFASGQIVGPVALGSVSDGAGLPTGFVYSALILLMAGLVALKQKPLSPPNTAHTALS